MKTSTFFLLITACSLFFNCSSDDELPEGPPSEIPTAGEKPQTEDPVIIPAEPTAPTTAQEIPGFPKSLKKYEHGELSYWANFFYSSKGNLIEVNYGYQEPSLGVFKNIYHYASDGKLLKLEGHEVYNYHWENDRIVQVDAYNAMWNGHSKIQFSYNDKGQIIEKEEINLDFGWASKAKYYYFGTGNLKKIEEFYRDEGEEYAMYAITEFAAYINQENQFLEVEIIPGIVFLQAFPTSKSYEHLLSPTANTFESYTYEFDIYGKVTERNFGNSRVVYEYY